MNQKKSHYNYVGAIIAALFLLGVFLACKQQGTKTGPVTEHANASPSQSTTPNSATEAVVNVPMMIEQSPEAFEKMFGKAISSVKTNDPGATPGEIRDYSLPGITKTFFTDQGLMVRFHNGKAVSIAFDFPTPVDNRDAAFNLAGLDVKGKTPNSTAGLAEGWKHYLIGNIFFASVEVLKLGPDGKEFTTFKAATE